jgi:hypothetical protein
MLFREEEGIQRPIYYSIWILIDAKTRYLKVEKIVLALVSTSRKLKPYFQTHQIIVLMDQPLQQILHKLNMFGWLVKWAIKIGEYGLLYQSRPTIKG